MIVADAYLLTCIHWPAWFNTLHALEQKLVVAYKKLILQSPLITCPYKQYKNFMDSIIMLEIHRADTRGVTKNAWLHSRHSFSFADYFDPDRKGVGKLRVLNDDIVAPGKGFDTHAHKNMEIVSIPLSGVLHHQDNLGNQHIISTGEVQIMSAGQGIRHAEYNHSTRELVNFLQIWVQPKLLTINPRYAKKKYDTGSMKNNFVPIVSPRLEDKQALWINQDTIFSLAWIETGVSTKYTASFKKPVFYIFIIAGEITLHAETLFPRDAVVIRNTNQIKICSRHSAQVLCIETTE